MSSAANGALAYRTGTGLSKIKTWESWKVVIPVSSVDVAFGWNENSTSSNASLVGIDLSTNSGSSWSTIYERLTEGSPTNFTVESGTQSGNPTLSSIQLRFRTKAGAKIGALGLSGNARIDVTDIRIEGTYNDAPTITSLSHSSCIDGTVVTITGTNFTGATSLTFGGVAVGTWSVISATQIQATMRNGMGTGSFVVTAPGGTSNASSSLTVNAATISANASFQGGYLTRGVNTSVAMSVSITNTPNNALANWSATGGGFNDPSSSSVVWAVPNVNGTYNVTSTAVVSANAPSVTRVYTVVEPPSISGFTATPTNPLYGGYSTLTPTFANGTGSIGSVGAVGPGGEYQVGPLETPTTYTLTVTNMAGYQVTRQVTVTPQTVSVSVSGDQSITLGVSNSVFTASVSGAENGNVNWTLVSGTGVVSLLQLSGTQVQISPLTTGTATVRATSIGDPTKYANRTITVYAVPVASSLTPAATTILKGTSTNLTPVFSSGTGAVSPTIGAVTSGGSYSTGNLSSSQTYTLTVTNPDGVTATKQTTVKVYDALVGSGIAVPSSFASLSTQIKLAGTSGAQSSASTPQLSTSILLAASLAQATTFSFGNIATIILMQTNPAVAVWSYSATLTTEIRLNAELAIALASPKIRNLSTQILLVGAAAAVAYGDNVSLTTGKLLNGVPAFAVTWASTPVLESLPIRLPYHAPRLYFAVDHDNDWNFFLRTLDQIFAETIKGVDLLPRNLSHANSTKFVQDLLSHYGNPFKFQVNDQNARELVEALTYLYTLRGTAAGVIKAVRFLLKREIELTDWIRSPWVLGRSRLESETFLEGSNAAVIFFLGYPADMSPQERKNLEAIVSFMSMGWIQIEYYPLSQNPS